MCGLAICSFGTPADKTKMLFDVFNLNRKEAGVTRNELRIMVFSTLQSMLSLHGGWPHGAKMQTVGDKEQLPPLTAQNVRVITQRLVDDAFDT